MLGRLEVLPVRDPRGPEARRFIQLPFSLYRACPQWVPPFRADMRALLERRHPFFEHSPGEFYIARRGPRTVGRVMALENTRYNARHVRRFGFFYLFECAEDPEAAAALLEAAELWARVRGLASVVGPGGMGAGTGVGVLVEGFEHRAATSGCWSSDASVTSWPSPPAWERSTTRLSPPATRTPTLTRQRRSPG